MKFYFSNKKSDIYKNTINMKKFYFFIFILISNIILAQSLTGVGYQKDIKEYWAINVQINSQDDITVSYPSLGCSGKWVFIKEDKNLTILKEIITFGVEKCIPENYIFMTRDDLSPTTFRFYVFENIGDEIPYALGVLEK